MFCSCSAAYQDSPPNSLVCPVCMGMPGVLPVINEYSVELVARTGLALNCSIAAETKFDRKNYPYPDLMKGYQISQFDQPIAVNGRLTIASNDHETEVGITRVHLEEDVAKLLHRPAQAQDGDAYSLLDINRAGVPLMEVVSEPDMRSADEARSYLTRLHSILRYIDVSTANMEEGSFRCDANISVRPKGSQELGAKVEVKNMNSFRSVYQALEYEADRQIRAVREQQRIVQETRGWVEAKGITLSQRSKEYASDYRYFPDPDLPPVVIDPEWVRRIEESLPELPQARKARLVAQFGLTDYDANLLTASKATADFFEEAVDSSGRAGEERERLAKGVSNWVLGELTRLLNLTHMDVSEVEIRPNHLVELLDLIDGNTLSSSMAKTVFEEMFNTGQPPKQIVEESGMIQISDVDAIESAVEEVVSANPQPVADYLNGKDTAIRFLLGQVMKVTKGKANPKIASDLLQGRLEAMR